MDHTSKALKIAPEVDLFVTEDDHFVWLCYAYPEGSFATLDLTMNTPRESHGINRHVSAQLGEWSAGRDDLAPDSP